MEVKRVNDELKHWGIKGQKWGIRRFQNKDGSLTLDGGRRYNGSDYKPRKSSDGAAKKVGSALKKAGSATVKAGKATKELINKSKEKKRLKEEEKRRQLVDAGKVSTKNMTTEEINRRIDRLNLEKRYNQILKETNPSNTVINEGKSFVNKMWKEAVMPAAAEAGKTLLKDSLIKQGTKSLGLDKEDSLKKASELMQNKYNKAKYERQLYEEQEVLKQLKSGNLDAARTSGGGEGKKKK